MPSGRPLALPQIGSRMFRSFVAEQSRQKAECPQLETQSGRLNDRLGSTAGGNRGRPAVLAPGIRRANIRAFHRQPGIAAK